MEKAFTTPLFLPLSLASSPISPSILGVPKMTNTREPLFPTATERTTMYLNTVIFGDMILGWFKGTESSLPNLYHALPLFTS